ncbi:MAG: hypothetical protein AAB788_01790, partial [Patescibacteria group bacterium]
MKYPREVQAIPGQLNVNALTGTIQNFSQVGIGGDVTGGSAKLYVNGNVGIGTTSPGSNLEVNAGGLNLTKNILTVKGGGSSGAYGFSVQANNGSELFKVDTLSYNVTMANGGVGNVGIGTTAPNTNLMIYESNTDVLPALKIAQGSTGDASMFFNADSAVWAMGLDNSDSNKFKISTDTSSADVGVSTVFTIQNNGNVGIGTTGPVAKLDVNGDI